MRDVSLSAQKFEDFSDDRAAPRRSKAPFPPDFGPVPGKKERPALARVFRGPRLGVLVLSGIAGLALIGVPLNALFLQDGRHPAPLFGARVLKPEPIETAAKGATMPAAAPRAARSDAARPEAEPNRPEAASHAKAVKPQPQSDAAALAAEILKSEAPAPAAPAKPVKKRETVASRDAIGALLGGAAPTPTPAASPRPTVAAGPDQNVLSAERALQRLGYVVKPDGLMSPELRKTIEKFQRDNGLQPTGQLGPQVMKLLSAHSAAGR